MMKRAGENRGETESQEALPMSKSPKSQFVKGDGGYKDKMEIAAGKPVNRSRDLMPLRQDYDLMRKELKALISSAQVYHDAMIQLSKARMDVSIFIVRVCDPVVQ